MIVESIEETTMRNLHLEVKQVTSHEEQRKINFESEDSLLNYVNFEVRVMRGPQVPEKTSTGTPKKIYQISE